mgnify:FL=1|tara:strand:+ start:373 stop:942 length:570 start_codon:yes stop_codon:yes gene_type:complete
MNRFLFNSIFYITLTIVLLFLGSSITADQNDPRLEVLFKDLKTSQSMKKASSIELQIWKIWMEHRNPKAKSSMFLGIAAMNNQQFGKALGHFGLLTEIEPDFAEGWNKRATVFYLLGRFNESQEDVERTLKLEPRHFGALSGLGLIRMELRDWPGAISALEAALRLHPHMTGVIRNLKYVRKKQNESMT